MITVPVRHLILHRLEVEPPPATPAFRALLHDCGLWWAQYGVELDHWSVGTKEVLLNTLTDEPWPQVAGWWMQQPDYDPAVCLVAFLSGWDSQKYIGWGGRLGITGGLAVVGEYAIDRLLSRPTTPEDATDAGDPESLVDDWDAGKLYLHEMGHCLGLPHDFGTAGAVMGYGNERYNAILGGTSALELERQWAPPVEQADAYLLVQACRRP